MDCNFEKKRCQCIIESPLKLVEDNMVKKTIKWVWKVVSWPFKKALEWMKSSLPK
jgi:hypothetical protein